MVSDAERGVLPTTIVVWGRVAVRMRRLWSAAPAEASVQVCDGGGFGRASKFAGLEKEVSVLFSGAVGDVAASRPPPIPVTGNTDRWRSREAAAVPGPRSLNRPKAMVHGTHGPGPSATPCASTRRVRASIGRLPLPHVPPQWPPPSRRRAWRKTHAPAGAGPGCAFARRCAPRKTRRAQALLWCSARSLLVLCHWVAGSRWRALDAPLRGAQLRVAVRRTIAAISVDESMSTCKNSSIYCDCSHA